ncbi:AP-1 complex subunit gamma [Balamuthia mandrillaris]
MTSIKLIDLIKAVRNCKTAADERSVIAKECARIRTDIKGEDPEFRHRNVAKLLYIHMLGYPTHFGQMECLKLIASPNFPDKRVGYLGLMVLLDETQEVLMLATHSLISDLNHPNQYVVGLALCSIANVSSAEIARDAAQEVRKLLASTNPYIRKKAALCAVRIVRKVPETVETFLPRIKAMFADRNHAVILTGVSLMIELCHSDSAVIKRFRKLVPTLVRILKGLITSGYAPEHDVQGVTDPFLQVKILRAFAILGKGDAEASEAMNDILAQVCTNTENQRNVGNAILYESVQTIMTIEAESGLRVLAINILGRFLLNKDNNIRYVALNTLSKVVGKDLPAVQRHLNTIVSCLKDPDISIRRRALDLTYALVNRENIQTLVREMLNFLVVAEHELRPEIATKICTVTERFAPNKRWHVDTILRVLSFPGQHVQEQILSNLVALIASSSEIQEYAVGKMYLALKEDITPQPMVQVGVWCIGEFGDLLVAGLLDLSSEEQLSLTVSENEVLDLLEVILHDLRTVEETKEYVVTCLMKLSTRFSPNSLPRLRTIIQAYDTHLDAELQQRSCEYTSIFKLAGNEQLRATLLERMPAPEDIIEYRGEHGDLEGGEQMERVTSKDSGNLVDLLGLGDILPSSSKPSSSANSILAPGNGSSSQQGSNGVPDLLAGIFGGSSSGGKAPSSGGAPIGGGGGMASLLDLLSEPPSSGGGAASPSLLDSLSPPGSSGSAYPPLTAFQKNGLNIVFTFAKPGGPSDSKTHITMTATNSTNTPFHNFVFQVAVPKYLQLQLNPPSGSILPPNCASSITQLVELDNTQHGQKPLMLKIRVEYLPAGAAEPVIELATVSSFPPTL